MTVDLTQLDQANAAVQASTGTAKATKAFAQAATDVLHAMNPKPATWKMLLGVSNNVGGGGSLDLLTKLYVKVTREDTAGAFSQLATAGIKCVQIIPSGQPGAADGRAWCYQLGGNEWYFLNGATGIDPAAFYIQLLADAIAIRQSHPGALISIPLVAYGWSSPLADGWGACDDHGNYRWNGQTKPAVQWMHDAAPELLTIAASYEVHIYGPRGLANMDLISSQLKTYGVTHPRFLVGEDGYSTYNTTEQAQADYLSARFTAISQRPDVDAYIVYRGQDLVGQSNPAENNYGIEKTNPNWSDGGPKAAFSVVQSWCKAQ